MEALNEAYTRALVSSAHVHLESMSGQGRGITPRLMLLGAGVRRRTLAFAMVCLGASLGCAGASAEPAASSASVNGRIAFVSSWAENLASEVYRVDVASGRRTNLSRHPGSDYGAAVSPDGRTILFVRRGDQGASIWAMDADGKEQRQLGAGDAPVWSPDGTRIAFTRHDELLTMAADGQDVRPLATRCAPCSAARGRSPAWSPDSRMLAWIDRSSVFVGSADGSSARRLYSTTVLFSAPTWSPDGTQVAVAAEVLIASGTGIFHGIVTIPVAGGEARRLASIRLLPEESHVDMSWSSDGKRIAYVGGRQILSMRVADGVVVALTRPPRELVDTRPAWSPDGRFLAFARGRQLFVVPASGGKARQVTNEDVHSVLSEADLVVWTPDGRSLVYSNGMAGNDSDVYTVDQDGTGRRRLTTNDVDDSSPAFSPDGRWIAFVRTVRHTSADNQELFLMRADGSGVRRLTHRRGEDFAPAWSPDGSRIVFVSSRYRDGRLSLYTIRPDGTGLTRLRTPWSGFASAYDSPTWSPDGRAVALSTWSGDCEEEDEGELLALRTRRGRLDRLVDLGLPGAWSPEWSPDGKAISFLRRPDPCARFIVPDPGLWTVEANGGAAKMLLEGVFDAAWSPDGRHFVVLRWVEGNESDLGIVSRNGSIERELTAARGAGSSSLSWQPLCTFTGGPRADRLRAGARAARVCGLGGDDFIRGGRSSDRLFGAEGDDTIDARGGGFDVVGCGPGRDRVVADRKDLVGVDCEEVTRR